MWCHEVCRCFFTCWAGDMARPLSSRDLAGCGIREMETDDAVVAPRNREAGVGSRPSLELAGASSRAPARSQTVCIGAGLSSITRKLVEKIQANEYVEFADLIPAGGRSRVPTPQGDGQIMVIQAADLMTTRKVIPDLATWLQCFAVYVAVLGPYQPDKLADLMGYQSLIARASKKFKWPSWLVYDQNFRQEAAGNTSLQWAKAEPSLYAQCFTGQEISKENWCSRCHGVDHQSADCPYGHRKRTWSGGPGAVSVSQHRAAATGGRDQQLCIKFNRYGGDCKFRKECKFLHACSSCKGPHPVSKCRAGGKAALGRMDEA